MPEAAIGWAAEMVAVKVTGKALTRTKMDDAGHGRMGAVVHLVPAAGFCDALPAFEHRLKIARPGKRVTGNWWMGLLDDAHILDDVLVTRHHTVRPKDQPGHIDRKRVV